MNILGTIGNAIRRLSLTSADVSLEAGRTGDAGETVTENSAMSLSAVWACVNLLSGTISSLPLMVYRRGKDGARTVAADHPLYRLLHDRPNYDQTALDFWDFICGSIELWGNAYARIERSGSRITALVPIQPDCMTVRRLTSGTLEYRWSANGKSFVGTDKTVLHIRGPGGNPLGGMSTLDFGRHTFSLARAAEKTVGTTFQNGLRPSGVLKFDKFLTPDQRQIARDEIAAKVGADRSGRPLILEGGSAWQQLTINPKDAQMLESRGYSVEEICRYFGVPPFMIGHTEKSTSWGTGIEQQTLGFQKFTLRRRLKRIEQALAQQLLTPVEIADGLSFEFNIEGLLRADSAGRAAFYLTMTNMGAMTINEVRALENLPPVEGGDVPRMQMQNVPITQNAGIGHNGGPPLNP